MLSSKLSTTSSDRRRRRQHVYDNKKNSRRTTITMAFEIIMLFLVVLQRPLPTTTIPSTTTTGFFFSHAFTTPPVSQQPHLLSIHTKSNRFVVLLSSSPLAATLKRRFDILCFQRKQSLFFLPKSIQKFKTTSGNIVICNSSTNTANGDMSSSSSSSSNIFHNHNNTSTDALVATNPTMTTVPLQHNDGNDDIIPIRIRSALRIITSTLTYINRVINHSILLQLCILMILYILHLTILSQHVVILCYNTIAMGYDSFIGSIIFIFYVIIQRVQQQQYYTNDMKERQASSIFPWNLPRPLQQPTPPPSLQQHHDDVNTNKNSNITNSSESITIVKVDSSPKNNINNNNNNNNNNDQKSMEQRLTDWIKKSTRRSSNNIIIDYTWIRFRISMVLTCTALIKAYYQTGRYSLFWEDLLYSMSAAGWALTIPLSRSIQVLAGHLTWVIAGCTILWAIPRPPPFFQSLLPLRSNKQHTVLVPRDTKIKHIHDDVPSDDDSVTNIASTAIANTAITQYRWFQMSLRDSNWVWWTIGGYYVSSWLFNIADVMNRNILPLQVLQDATESVVTQLVQPEQNDIIASMIGYIAPCVSAPVWEELLYRGFLLAGLTTWTGSYHVSCIVQAIIFSAHHMSITAALPLAVLGYIWAILYTQSKNLWTVIAVHAMWNSRVFLGSWFGL